MINIGDILTLHDFYRVFDETGDKRLLQSEALGIAIGSPYYENCNILWLI